MQNYLLLWLVALPAAAAGICLFTPEKLSKNIALATSIIGVALSIVLWRHFDAGQATQMQLKMAFPWISAFGIQFALGVDGLSFPLVVLSKWMMPVALLASWGEHRRVPALMACYLILDSAMVGTFLATDVFLFYVFWELMLIPMLLIIGVWGSQNRIYASVKFFLYTFAGSVFMLVAIFWLFIHQAQQAGAYSAQISSFYNLVFPSGEYGGLSLQDWIFLAFTIAFLIKVPLFPLHTWLPDAHVQAPAGGSILLAAVLLKMGVYGLLRFSIPIAPAAFLHFRTGLGILSLIGIVYGAWVAFQQTDMKKLVAYSSVSHLAFVVLGICTMSTVGLTGAMLQTVNHGLSTGALFFLVGVLYDRRHTRNFADYGGLAKQIPVFAFFLVFVACSSMAVPGLNGFIGEFMVLMSTYQMNQTWGIIAVSGVVFGAAYMLLLVRNVLFGEIKISENRTLSDLNPREWAGLLPLAILMVVLGIAPQFFLDKFRGSLEQYWNKPAVSSSNDGFGEKSKFLKASSPLEDSKS